MSFAARTALASALSFSIISAATAADSVHVAALAAASGYTYQWLASEGGVSLQRPGVVILLHAGYPLYEVNAVPMQADAAPQFANGDLVISRSLAERLRRIAILHPIIKAPPPSPASLAMRSDETAPMTGGGSLTLQARQIPGREAFTFSGVAPARSAVTITLTGLLSTDLPAVVISRITVTSADDGSYSVVASIGPDTHRGTTIAATATTPAGLTSAVARIKVDAPSPNVNSLLDQFPPK